MGEIVAVAIGSGPDGTDHTVGLLLRGAATVGDLHRQTTCTKVDDVADREGRLVFFSHRQYLVVAAAPTTGATSCIKGAEVGAVPTTGT